MKIRVSRDFHTKKIYDVYDFWHGRTYRGRWDRIPLPENGWRRVSNAEFIVITIA